MKKAVILLALIACQRVSEPVSHVEVVREETYHELSDWAVLQMAIIMTESRFNPKVVGKHQDTGIMQITEIYIKEINRLSGEHFILEDAFDVDKSLLMFDIMQSFKNPSRDIEKAIYYHNKSPYYKKVVLQNMEFIRRYEYTRKRLKDE